MAAPLAKSWISSETSAASPRPAVRAARSAPAAPAGHTVKDLQRMLSSAFADDRGDEQKWSIGNAIAFGLACSLFLWSVAAFAAAGFL